jgi:hypothetical protein
MDDLEFLKTHPPLTVGPSDAATSAARAALRERIDAEGTPQASAQPRSRRRTWRWVAAAAATLAVAAAGAYVVLGGVNRPATAAAAVLHQAAATARSQPSPTPLAAGEYLYVKSEGVGLITTSLANGATVNARATSVREVWMGADSQLRETSGKPEFVTAKDRQAWIDAGRPQFYQPGTSTESLGAYKPLDLPTNPTILYAQLKLEAIGHGTGLYNEMFVLVGDDLRETATLPAVRAALYEVAARIPGVELVGNVTDPAGRAGVAVAMTDATSHTRQVLTLDPQTSQLLDEAETVTAGNEFGWPDGTLMGRTTYLVSAVVGSNSELPPSGNTTPTSSAQP